MESNSEVERACVYGIESLNNNHDNSAEHDVIVDLTLDLEPEAVNIRKGYMGSANENTNGPNAFVLADRLKTKCLDGTANIDDHNMTITTVTTRIPGTTEDIVVSEDENKSNEYTQNDYLLVDSDENNNKNEFVNITQDKCALLKINERGASETTFLDISDNLKKIEAFSNADHKAIEKIIEENHFTYNAHGNEFHESEAGLATDYENHDEHCFSTQVHLICENHDLFSEHDAIGKEYYIDHSCHHNVAESDQPSTSCATNLKHENPEVHIDLSDEFHNDQYENIEFSNIFSSVDIHQRSFYQNYTTENTSLLQENSEDRHNFIAELDSHTYEKSMADSGVFGLSLNDTRSVEFLQSDEGHYFQRVPSADKFSIDMQAEQNNSILFKLDDLHSTPTVSNIRTNFTPCSDPNSKLVNCLSASHQEYNSGWHSVATAPTGSQSAAALSLHYSQLDKLHPESPIYDPRLSDYNKNYQMCLYQNPQAYSATYAEWPPWVKTSTAPYDIHMPFICSKPTTSDGCSVSSTDIRDNLAKPEVKFLQMEAQEDDEETDDADEIDYLPLPFSTKYDNLSQHMRTESLSIPVYQDENSTAVYGPSVLTPPPSASSTPVPSCQDSCMSDDVNIYSPWSASHYDAAQTYSSSARTCKLKSEQLETSLLSFGLQQGTKRPFPSMADVMRNPRSKRAIQKKCVLEVIDQQPRRSGRPRKNQIQSDKISTTAMNSKHKKKATFKLKCEAETHDVANSHEILTEAGSSRTSAATRHNEPLNQIAIEIMTQWFEGHIENPYPSKPDKEKMAAQGGITENQVKSWFANKRNRTNNTKPKVEKRAMEEKLKEIFRDLKRNNHNPMADNSHVIQQLSGIIQHCHSTKQD